MTQLKTLLELRSKIKGGKPEFIRQDYLKRSRVHKRQWRKPKGIHSKMRHHRRGKSKLPSPGYGSPALVRGLHFSGLMPVLVENESQLPQSKEYGVVISGRVGMKKKAQLVRKAEEKGLIILNFDAEKFLKKFEESVSSKKKKEEKQKDKAQAAEEKKTEKKKEEQPEVAKKNHAHSAEEDRKKSEKLEKDRLLTKKV